MKQALTGFRKFIMATTFIAVAVILLIAGYVPAEDWMKHMATVMTAFMATNVGEHIINVGKEWIANKKWNNMKTVMKDIKK